MTSKPHSSKEDDRLENANLGQKDAEQQDDKQTELSHMGELSKSTPKKNQKSGT